MGANRHPSKKESTNLTIIICILSWDIDYRVTLPKNRLFFCWTMTGIITLSTAILSMMAREGILKSYLDGQKEQYDYILIDCSPSLGIVTTNALVAADKLYIPLTAEALPLKGLTMLDDVVSEVKRRVNPELEVGGVFFTRFNNRKLNKEVVSMVQSRYGDKVFQTKIRENIAIAEMPLSGQTIFEYDPKSNGAADYWALSEEIIARERNR